MFTFPSTFYRDLVFKSTWNTENLGGTGSATKVILLPITAGPRVDWGDGIIDNLNTHTYSVAGIKTIKIHGPFGIFRFNDLGDKLKITDVSNVGGLVINSSGFFRGCANMTWSATGAPTITALSISQTFRDCALFDGDVSEWNVVTSSNMNGMFRGTAFNGDLSSWDFSSATNIGNIFRDTPFNQDISAWNIASVTIATNFMLNNTTFTQTNYDLLLPAWEAQSVQDSVSVDFGSAVYGAGAPATARAALISDHTWTITDGGPA